MYYNASLLIIINKILIYSLMLNKIFKINFINGLALDRIYEIVNHIVSMVIQKYS